MSQSNDYSIYYYINYSVRKDEVYIHTEMASYLDSRFGKLKDTEASVMSLAAKIGDWSSVYEILDKRPDLVNYIPEYRPWSILHQASNSGNEDAVKRILSIPECDPSTVARDGLRANELTDDARLKELIEAAQAGRPVRSPAVKYRVIEESFEELQQADTQKVDQISEALERGDITEVVDIIDTNQHLVNVVPAEVGLAPLHQAALMGDVTVVEKILYYPAADPDVRTTAADKNVHGAGKTAEQLTSSEEVRAAISWKKQQLTREYYTCPTFVEISDSNYILMDYCSPTIEAHRGLLCPEDFDSESFSVFPQMLEDVFLYLHYSAKWEEAWDITSKELSKFERSIGEQLRKRNTKESFYRFLIEVYTSEKMGVYRNLNSELRNQAVKKKKKNTSTQFSVYSAIVNCILFVWGDLQPYTDTTYRGMNLTGDDLDTYSVGTEFAWLNFVSSSSSKRVAEKFKTKPNSIFVIDNKTECKWSPKSIEAYSAHEREREYIYPCGAQFRVTHVEQQDKVTFIHLDLINKVDARPLRSVFEETVSKTELDVLSIQQGIKDFEREYDQLKQIQDSVNANRIEMYNNDSYQLVKEEERMEEEPLPRGVFIYSCIWCKTVCHDPCTERCGSICRVAIPDNQCTVCSAKCPWSLHKKTPFRMRTVKERKAKINEFMKSRYVSAETDHRENTSMMERLEYALEDERSNLDRLMRNVNENVSLLESVLEINTKDTGVLEKLLSPSNEQTMLKEFKREIPKLAKRLKKIDNLSMSAF